MGLWSMIGVLAVLILLRLLGCLESRVIGGEVERVGRGSHGNRHPGDNHPARSIAQSARHPSLLKTLFGRLTP